MPLTDPGVELQRALVKKLTDDAELKALIAGRVLDRVKPDAPLPYVNLGEMTLFAELGAGTDAADSTLVIHAWSEKPGYGQVKEIGARIIALLHDQDLQISGGVVQSFLLESARYLRDPDGLVSHGVLTFDVLTDANT